jgi:hypothetical protein
MAHRADDRVGDSPNQSSVSSQLVETDRRELPGLWNFSNDSLLRPPSPLDLGPMGVSS